MKPGVAPNVVSSLKPFHQSTFQSLDDQPSGSFSGISKDGSYCWVVRGAQLEVLDMATRDRLGAWQFGKVLGDENTNVTCVEEFSFGLSRKLLVGVCNNSTTGLLCMFNVAQSKVTKAIEVPQRVTEIEVVCTQSRSKMPRWALSEQLRYFCGLVAVGTNNGYVYLVDMALDDSEFYSDEEVPGKVQFISPRNRDIENQRFHCMSQGHHLCMGLNESMFTRQGFEYQKPDGIVMKTFQPERISVTSLTYVPQIGILVVGYNFGCFQLWKLSIPVLEYSSRLEFEQMPVTHVAYQEPENDPKNFCYIWVARGHRVTDEELETVSCITMYQMTFNHKFFYSNYGVFYDELASICERLSHELTSTPIQYGSNFEGVSRIVACFTLTDANYQPPITLGQNESYEESSHAQDQSLCVFVWEVSELDSAKAGKHLAVFDINRWYHAQMPSTVRYVSGSAERCSYFCFCRLDEAVEKADYENILGVHVTADRLRKFISMSVIPPEQHFYPSSLAFDLKLVFETGVVEAQFMGAQRQVLGNLEKLGARALVQPQDLHSLCIYVGLLPQPQDGGHSASNLSQQRESLLSLALDYNLISLLKSCIVQWSGGEFEYQGCNLRFLIDWLWDKVSDIKHQIDTMCVNLYNWSGLTLDQRSLQTLQQCDRRLKHLTGLIQVFIQTGTTTEQGAMDLQSKLIVASLLSQHLNIVLWFVGANLLPERDDTETIGGKQFCYPVTGLTLAYKRRRTELQQIHSELKNGDLLMIDGLVEFLGVGSQWEREGGSGQYPPPSLHALLSSYLLENVDSLSKHCLVLYLLLDLVSLDGDEDKNDFSEKVPNFAMRFGVPHTLVKCIQAFWLLDHRDFEEALVLMLDPLVTAEFSRWQHSRVIKALLYQGDAKMALRYITSVKPALNTPEEVKLKLTVLLANGMTAEALEYQRVCRDQNNCNDLLTHLFLGCQQTKTVDRLLQLPMTTEEEAILVQYLIQSSEPYSQELLVMHYLQRARFIEAIQLNEKLKHTAMIDANPKARERAAARNAIVDSFAKLLPTVQRKLMYEQAHVPRKANVQHSVCARPTPLSTKITQNKASVMSRSAFIFTIIEKLDEIETENDPANETTNKSLGPFICTPVTPARKSLRDTPATAYPEPVEEAGRTSTGASVLGKSLLAFQDGDTPKGMDKRQSRFFSASCMSLLQTPKVQPLKSRTPSKSSASVVTPQSILKIRNITTKMSPSPHSSNTTPNSQELETSSRKLPRKLGYGTASKSNTPASVSFSEQTLSSVPRHLAQEMSVTPSSPKPSTSSQPTTPKSVSFADKTFTRASKLKTLATPVKGNEPESTTPATHKTGLAESPVSPSDLSSDGLHRRPLRTTPPKTSAHVDSGDISDEEIEEMDTSETSPSLRLEISTSPSESISKETTPPASPQKSPRKPTSPTVKISKSPVSAFSPKARDKSPEEATSSAAEEPLVTASNGAESVTVDLTEDDEMEVETADTESPETEADMSKAGSSVHEMFEADEEITPTEELIEEEGIEVAKVTSSEDRVDDQVDVREMVKQEETEMSEPPVLVRQLLPPQPPQSLETEEKPVVSLRRRSLTPISERNLKLITPKSSPKSSPGSTNSSKSDASPSTSYQDQILKMIDEKFGDSPDIAQVESTSEAVQPRTRTRKTFDIKPVKVENRELTVDEPEMSVASTSGVNAESKTAVEKVVQEAEVSASDSSHVPAESSEDTEEPTTPSRTRRSRRKVVDEETQEPVTPTRSTRRQQQKVEAEQSTSTVSDTIARTPTRSTKNKTMKQEVTGELVEISVMSPKKFSQEAKEIVQESLLQISENMQRELETSPTNMTKIKSKKDPEASVSSSPSRYGTRSRRSESPTGDIEIRTVESNETESALMTPPKPHSTRQTTPGISPETNRENTNNAENISPKSKSPSRSTRNNNNNNNSSPSRRSVDTSELSRLVQVKRTPTRSRKKKDNSSDLEQGVSEIGAITVLPQDIDTNNSSRQSFERSELPVEFIESVETTPSRRRSLPRNCKSDLDELPRTPTRRQSLAHSTKLLKEEVNNVDNGASDSAQTKSSLVRTPSRRGRPKKTELENIVENEQSVLTPSRRGRAKKIEPEDTESTEEPVQPSTPSRRGRSKKMETDDEEQEPRTPSRRGRTKKDDTSTRDDTGKEDNKEMVEKEPTTPSRRGRAKKTEAEPETKIETQAEPLTPSRRGRPKKTTDLETGGILETSESLPLTPSRRGRPKKTETVETEVKTVSPARQGRSKKGDTEMEVTSEEEAQPATPSRRGRNRKADMEKHLEDEKVPLTPSRSKKARKEKDSPTRAGATQDKAGKDTGSSPRVSNLELYDIQSASFQFSGPMLVDNAEGPTTPVKPFTPSKSFIFSPPIVTTRSSSHERAEKTGILLPPGETEASVKEKTKKSKKETTKKSRNRKLYSETDKVLLISPLGAGKDDSGSEGLDIITRTTRAGTKKVETKKDGTHILLRGLGVKPKRTSYRFGPVGKKKTEK